MCQCYNFLHNIASFAVSGEHRRRKVMAKEKPETKQCKHCKTEIPYDAKICPNCKKRVKGGKVKWVVLAIVIIFILIAALSGGNDDDTPSKVGTVNDTTSSTTDDSSEDTEALESGSADDMTSEGADTSSTESETKVQTVYHVGDILMDGEMKIVYMSSGVYTEDNEYLQPEDGYQYIYLQFSFENQSETTDDSVSFYSFDGYADGYSIDMYYSSDDALSATLSAGRSTSGYIYFNVPVDAQEIEVEYTTNYFTADKITFLYEGENDSGYTLESNTVATEGAFAVGDIIETRDLTITYLSCEADTSYSDYYQPKEGYHYVTCEFEFENTGDGDEYVSIYDFDCYADGISCDQSYFRDDALSATISSGHKTKGTVTFAVPDAATTIEVEYLTNYWTSNRIVFSCTY